VGVAPTDLTVGLWFSGTNRGIHQYGYGGLDVDSPYQSFGALWRNLTTYTLTIERGAKDTDVEQVHVVVVHGDPPHYDSGWQGIAAGSELTLTHNLAWNPTMLLVRGECYDASGFGINQMFSGGNHDSSGFMGMHFERLTGFTVVAVRRANDDYCDQVRVRIWKRAGYVYLPAVLRSS